MKISKNFDFNIPTRIKFGPGSINSLSGFNLPGKKAMVVTSSGKSASENGYLALTQEQLLKSGINWVLYDNVTSPPLDIQVMEGVKFAKENNCDFIIALGGGSVIDCAKVISFMYCNPGEVWDYVRGGTGKGMWGNDLSLPLISIPTTSGSGSEVNSWGVITNSETGEKISFGGYKSMTPQISIVDPNIIRTTPPEQTVYQGFTALYHCTECYISNKSNFMSHTYASAAIEAIYHFLPRAFVYGFDIKARSIIAYSSIMAGYAMELASFTSEHSLANTLCAFYPEIHPGAAVIMISRAYYELIISKHVCDERFVEMAGKMGLRDATQPLDFIAMLLDLQRNCGVNEMKMTNYDIDPEDFVPMAKRARATMGNCFKSDLYELSEEDCVEIYCKSYYNS